MTISLPATEIDSFESPSYPQTFTNLIFRRRRGCRFTFFIVRDSAEEIAEPRSEDDRRKYGPIEAHNAEHQQEVQRSSEQIKHCREAVLPAPHHRTPMRSSSKSLSFIEDHGTL